MNRLFILIVLLLGVNVQLSAQIVPDTAAVAPKMLITYDSLKVELQAGKIRISESDILGDVLKREIVRDGSQMVTISRISIFFDNSQNARAGAIETMTKFEELFPDIPATMTHENPYFKVSVGFCISNDEALILLNKLRKEFPKAFLVRERVSVDELKQLSQRHTKGSDDEQRSDVDAGQQQ